MTLISNGPAPSLAVDTQEKSFKPESPPLNEQESHRFKESLDKAISRDSQLSEKSKKNDKTSPVNDRDEVHRRPGDSVKKLIQGDKKLLSAGKKNHGNSTEIISEESEEKDENSESSSQLKLLHGNSLKKETEIQRVDKKEMSVKSIKKSTGRKLKNEDLPTSPDETAVAASALIEIEAEESPENRIPSHERTGNEDAVLVPFSRGNESDIQAGTPLIDSSDRSTSQSGKIRSSNKKKGRDEQILRVIDTRNHDKNDKIRNNFVSKTSGISENIEQAGRESNQIILGEQNGERTAADEIKSFESRFNENKEVLLARELKESGNDQIVKKASFILKDGNQGEIKLILKPESLGQVKIQLNMNENDLVGKIIVENSRVRQIFENNLNDLSKSFEEAGISSSSIEVSVGDGSKGDADQNRSNQNDQPFFSSRLKTLDNAVPFMGRNNSGPDHQLVNLVV
ncbi:MAG: flagellar hook-length control protein FliK [Spirochaetaceae bacterium]|nr:flagellar hook-length control protein FliK [Spirochaetaceae bacterium]